MHHRSLDRAEAQVKVHREPLLGSLILITIDNGANLLNVEPSWQRIITGGLVLVIVSFDQLRRERR